MVARGAGRRALVTDYGGWREDAVAAVVAYRWAIGAAPLVAAPRARVLWVVTV